MTECTQVELLLSAQLDDMLTMEEAALVEAHLAVCPACRALAGELAQLSAAVAGLEVEAPDLLLPRVLEHLCPMETARARPARVAQWQRFAAMAAVFVLLVAGGNVMRQRLNELQAVQFSPAPSIQSAVDAVPPAGEGDTVLSGGVYTDGNDAALPVTPGAGDNGESAGEAGVVPDIAAFKLPSDAESDSVLERAAETELAAKEDTAASASVLPEPEVSPDSVNAQSTSDFIAFTAPAPSGTLMRENTETASDMPLTAPYSADSFADETEALPEPEETQSTYDASSQSAARFFLPQPAAVLTPAEAEAVLRLRVGVSSDVLTYSGVLPGGSFYRFDRVDAEEVYAVSMDGQTIVEKSSPEGELIENWDIE